MYELEHEIIEQDGLTLIKRRSAPWVVGKRRICSTEEYQSMVEKTSADSPYAIVKGVRIVIEAMDSEDVIVRGMKPDTIHNYLEKMAAWYIDSKVIQDYKAHKNLFTGRFYRLYYSNTVRFILLGLAIVLGIAAMVAVLWWLLPPFITVLTILIGLMVFGKEILFGR